MEKKTVQEFAESIKNKYPQYAEMDDIELTEKILAKYPQYKDMVELGSDVVKKKEDTTPEQEQPLQQPAEPSLPIGETSEITFTPSKVEMVGKEPTIDEIPQIDNEITGLRGQLEQVTNAMLNPEIAEEDYNAMYEQYSSIVEQLRPLEQKKQETLLKEETIEGADGKYYNVEALVKDRVKEKYSPEYIKTLDAPVQKPAEVENLYYTPDEVIEEKRKSLDKFDEEINELSNKDFYKYHYSDYREARQAILDRKKAALDEIKEASQNNMDIMMAETGAMYKIDGNKVRRHEFESFIKSREGTDRLKDTRDVGLEVYNDSYMQDLLEFQVEQENNKFFGEEALRGMLATTKSFIDGVDIKAAEAYMGIGTALGGDPEKVAESFGTMRVPGDPITKEAGYTFVKKAVRDAINEANQKDGNFRDNFLLSYAKQIQAQTEKVRGMRAIHEFDAIDRLLAGDIAGFTSDVVGMSVESLPYMGAMMIPYVGVGLVYGSTQTNEYYKHRLNGVSKKRAFAASNMTAAIETADAIIERILFKNNLKIAGGILDKGVRIAGYSQKEIQALRRNIISNLLKEYPTEFTQGMSGALIDQWANREEINFEKAGRQGILEGFATGPTTMVISSPSALKLVMSPLKKYQDIVGLEKSVEELLEASITPGNEVDMKVLSSQVKTTVNEIVKNKKEIEALAEKSSPNDRQKLVNLTMAEISLENAIDAAISEESKALLRAKLEKAKSDKEKILKGIEQKESEPLTTENISSSIKPETSENYSNMTQDENGDYVFYHVSNAEFDEVDPAKFGTGENNQTSKDELREIAKVGGVSMFYTSPNDGETMVTGSRKYQVKVKKEKVYDANEDPLNLKQQAFEMHEKEHPGKSYDGNTELAYMTKIAAEKGFDMVVGSWSGKSRAQSTKKLAVHDVQIKEGNNITKPFEKDYRDNKRKGWKSIPGESMVSRMKPVLSEITKIFNKKKDYSNKLYNAENAYAYDFGDKFNKFSSQEELTNLINKSEEVPQELKDRYNTILKEGDLKGKSIMDETFINRKNEYIKKLNEYRKNKSDLSEQLESGKITESQYKEKSSELNRLLSEEQKRLDMDNSKAGIETRDNNWDQREKSNLPRSSFKSENELLNTLENGSWGMLTGENPNAEIVTDEDNNSLNKKAEDWLKKKGYKPVRIFGKYGNSERSFFVPNLSREHAVEFAREFNQESVATNEGLVYQDGSFNPKTGQKINPNKNDLYSTININGSKVDFAVDYNFDETVTTIEQEVSEIESLFSEPKGDLDAAIENLKSSLKGIGVKVKVFNTRSEMISAYPELAFAKGGFDGNTNTVILNKETSTEQTVMHEGTHAVLLAVAKNTAPKNITGALSEISTKLYEELATDPNVSQDLLDDLESFMLNYGEFDPEEFVSEFVARLGAEINSNKKSAGPIMNFINSILKLLGLKPIEKKENAADFINKVYTSLKTGKEIDLSGVDMDLKRIHSIDPKTPGIKKQLTAGTKFKITGKEKLNESKKSVNTRFKKSKDTGVIKEYLPFASIDEAIEESVSNRLSYTSSAVSTANKLAKARVKYKVKVKDKYKSEDFNMGFADEAASAEFDSLINGIKRTKNAKNKRAKTRLLVDKAKELMNKHLDYTVDTLLGLYDTLTPEFINNSKNWYEGANRFANDLAKRYGISLEQSGGIIATLSPQKDWFTNVSNAERVCDILKNDADVVLTKEMYDKAYDFITRNDKKDKENSSARQLREAYSDLGAISINDIISNQDMSYFDKINYISMYLRAIDHAQNNSSVIGTKPSGEIYGLSADYNTWNSFGEISKAVSIYYDGSLENISLQLGNGNKVRNFFMNIVAPNSNDNYTTIDTHALAAAIMMPASASTAGDGLKLFSGGDSLIYAQFKEAYIRAAKLRGLKPREMQSILWEAIRTGINNPSRSDQSKQEVRNLSEKLKKDKINAYERAVIIASRFRSAQPEWARAEGINVQRPLSELLQINERRANSEGSIRIPLREYGVETEDRRANSRMAVPNGEKVLEIKAQAENLSINETIQKARDLGFSDAAIKQFLLNKGFKAGDINKALEVPFTIENTVPKSFGNIEGGMVEGKKLFDKIIKKVEAYAKRKVGKEKRARTPEEVRLRAQEYLLEKLENVTASEETKMQMQIEFDKVIGIKRGSQIASDIKEIRAELMARRRGAKSLATIKQKIRIFIKKSIPQSMYDKKEVMDLIQAVADATPENIQAILKDVNDLVVKHGVKTLKNRIAKTLNVKLNKLESGRLKGKILPEDQDLISGLISNMLQEDASVADIESVEKRLTDRYNELDAKDNLNQREYEEMVLIDVALNYNSSLLMEDNEVSKLQALQYVLSSIEDIKTGARMRMGIALAEQKAYYNSIKNEFFKDVTGLDIDFNSNESVLESRQKVRDRQAKKDNKSNFKKVLTNLFNPIDSIFIRVEGMEGLLDRISRMPAEMFGGKSSELILDAIDESSIAYKRGKMEMFKMLDKAAAEIFGKNHQKIMLKNAKPTEFYYSNPSKVEELVDALVKETDPKKKKKIEREIESYKMPISQNEMYYIYNQAKDEANHPGFESTFGPQYLSIIEHITNKLDPKVKEWADYQVEVFFPSVYEKYNAVYREIYRTDMPWNANYAGRIHREGDADQVNLLENTNQYQTSVGGGSTKVRIQNKKKIVVVDGDNNLNRYIDEMEFFAAYSESVRDINKMISNPDIRDGIIATTGKEEYQILKGQFDKIMRRNMADASEVKFLNFISNAFVKAKLGLSPVIFLKQTTSAIAFADYVGYRNWAKNLLSSDLASQWKELYANSVYLQDRYEVSDISKVLENYTARDEVKFLNNVQADKVNNFLMYMIKQGDKVGVMGSIPNYKYYKEKYMKSGMSEKMAIKAAVQRVERQIKTTQQSNDIQDKDFLQTSSPLMRMLNLFMSSPRALLRKEIISARNLYRKMSGQASKGTTKENLRTFFTYHVAIPMLFQYVSLGLPGLLRGWRDDDTEELGWAALLGNINALFALGDIAVSIKDVATNKPWAGDMRQIPIFQSIGDVVDSYKRFNDAVEDDTKQKHLTKMFVQLGEYGTGIPIANIKKFGENYSKLATGDVDDFGEAMLRFFNYSEYVIEGPPNKKKNKKKEENKFLRDITR